MTRNIRAILRMELENIGHFPVLEGIVCLLFFLIIGGVSGVYGQTVEVTPGPSWNGTSVEGNLTENIQTQQTISASGPLTAIALVLILMIPILVALTITRPMEDGTLQTYLSFPVDRGSVLLVKYAIISLTLWLSTTGSWILAVLIVMPEYGQILNLIVWSIPILVLCLSITATCILIALLTKRTGSATVVGLVFWYAALMLSMNPDIPVLVRGVLNPANLTWLVVLGGPISPYTSDLLVAMVGTVIIAIVTMVASYVVFDRMEV